MQLFPTKLICISSWMLVGSDDFAFHHRKFLFESHEVCRSVFFPSALAFMSFCFRFYRVSHATRATFGTKRQAIKYVAMLRMYVSILHLRNAERRERETRVTLHEAVRPTSFTMFNVFRPQISNERTNSSFTILARFYQFSRSIRDTRNLISIIPRDWQRISRV